MKNNKIKEIIENLPTQPGCYLFYNQTNQIIYIGKASNLKSRVNSYFCKQHLTDRQWKFINSINNIKYMVVNDNTEAMLLEENLIKKHQPYYNSVMTDDKRYPYIVISTEKYPRLSYVRTIKKNQKNAFGPFPDGYSARKILNLLNQVFKFRKCLHMPKEACIYYYIDQCYAPCINQVNLQVYADMIKQVKAFFHHDIKAIVNHLNQSMQSYSLQLNFEKAQEIKELIYKIKAYNQQQVINFNDKINRDVIGIYWQDYYLSLTIMFYRYGNLIHQNNYFMFNLNENLNDAINSIITSIYQVNTLPREIILNYNLKLNHANQELLDDTKIINPRKGKKLTLTQTANKNAYEAWHNHMRKTISSDKTWEQVKNKCLSLLKIKQLSTIDIVDNSFWGQGILVSVFMRYQNGIKVPHSFRRYNLTNHKEIISNNDYEAMKIGIKKRYSSKTIVPPDLLIVDGGLIQINAAKEIKNQHNLNFTIIGLSKDEHHQTKLLVLEDGTKIVLKDHKVLMQFFSHLQDDIHNFAINYYKTRAKIDLYASELKQINGIGLKREQMLLNYFGDINKVKLATLEQLKAVLPLQIATNVYQNFHRNKKT